MTASRTLSIAVLLVTVPLVGAAGLSSAQVDAGIACVGADEDVECDGLAVSGTGDADGCRSRTLYCAGASGTGNSSGREAVSATGDAHSCSRSNVVLRPCLAASGTGDVTGQVPLSALGRCSFEPESEPRYCVAASPNGDAEGFHAAASGTGNASANTVALSGTGHADSDLLAASATGQTSCKPHPPIVIDGDSSTAGLGPTVEDPATGTSTVRPGSGIVGGTGTEEDPYRIEGWCIRVGPVGSVVYGETPCPSVEEPAGIQVCDTEAHVEIANNTIVGERPHDGELGRPDGVRLAHVTNVTLTGNEIARTSHGVQGWGVVGANVTDNRIRGAQAAAVDIDGRGLILARNHVETSWAGLSLTGPAHSLTDNRIRDSAGGIKVVGDRSAIVDNVVQDTARGIQVNGDDSLVEANRIEDATVGIDLGLFLAGDKVSQANTVTNNTVEDSSIAAIDLYRAPDTQLSHNAIRGHNATGIAVSQSASVSIRANEVTGATARSTGIEAVHSAEIQAHGNNLVDNGDAGLVADDSSTADATHNWWGCPDGPDAEACDDVRGEDVEFTPWLTAPNPDAGPR